MIAPTLPARSGNGRAMRLGIFLEALAKVAAVDLVVVPARDAPQGSLSAELGVRQVALETQAKLDTQFGLLVRLRDPAARVAAFRKFGRPSLAAAVTPMMRSELAKLARERGYALVHVGRSYMMEAGVSAAEAGATLTVDLDEDDLLSYASQAEVLRNFAPDRAFDAEWLSAEGAASDSLIAAHASAFSRIWLAGEPELETVVARHPRLTPRLLPNAVEIPPTPPLPSAKDGALLFVGLLGYLPNRHGVEWFINSAWPSVRAASSKRRLVVAGAAPAGAPLRLEGEGISAPGYVDNLEQLYAEAAVFVAPLFCGGGTRIKLLEAAAHAVPIVATTVAARGLPFSDPESAWIADRPEAFVGACVEALANPVEAGRRAAAARALVCERHDRDAIVRGLASEFAELLG